MGEGHTISRLRGYVSSLPKESLKSLEGTNWAKGWRRSLSHTVKRKCDAVGRERDLRRWLLGGKGRKPNPWKPHPFKKGEEMMKRRVAGNNNCVACFDGSEILKSNLRGIRLIKTLLRCRSRENMR
jgi:hypothetical protein